jgi:hypothetical protein
LSSSLPIADRPYRPERPAVLSERGASVLRWGLLAYLALVLCPIRYVAPSWGTVDNTWLFALNYAAAHHLLMGRDIAWTWGPLSYLSFPFDIGNNLAKGLAFQTALWVLLTGALWDLFFHGDFRLRNLGAFSILIGFFALSLNSADGLLCAALILVVHWRLRGGNIRYVGALALLGVVPLIQFLGAMIAAGVTVGLIADLLLRGPRLAKREVALAVVVPAAVSLAGFRLALGSFHAVANYWKWSLELASGYSVAMSTSGPRVELVAAVEAIGLLGFALVLIAGRDWGKARFFALVLAIPLALNLKHGFVRQDAPHLAVFFCFAALAMALVMLAVPLDRQFTKTAVTIVVLLFAVLWQDHATGDDLEGAIVSVSGIGTPSLVWKAAHFERLRRSLDTEGSDNYSNAGIETEIRSIVGHQPVAFLSNVYSNASMEHLSLSLLPVFQRYSAYTPDLDALDAAWIDDKGPRFLLFDGKTIDGRQPWTETPRTWAEVWRWYDTRLLGTRNLLLERRAEPRFTHFEPVAQRNVRFGESLPMPLSAEGFWSVQCSLSTMGKLRALLLRVPPVMMDVNEEGKSAESFRVILPVMGAPSPGDFLPSSLAEFAEVFRDGGVRDFSVASVRFKSLGRNAYRPECQVRFFRTAP